MKINAKDKKKKEKLKEKIVKTKKDQVAVVAQEIKFARLLSGNENKTRERVLKTFKKWLQKGFNKGYEFKEDDFVRVWKGIFYAMWMSDKPLVQEDLSENIAGILDEFPSENLHHAILMIKAGYKVLATEWYGIDSHRMDKFLMLARRYLRGSLRCLQRCEWSEDSCNQYTEMLTNADGILCTKTPHYARNAKSLIMHFIDCFLEELAKVSKGKLPDSAMLILLKPFCEYSALGEVNYIKTACVKLFEQLLKQSEEGIMYAEATRAWKEMRCPKGGPDALELLVNDDDENDNDDSEDDDDTAPLDPRAGRVSVSLQSLPVPGVGLANILNKLLNQTSAKTHITLRDYMNKFEQYSRGDYPLKLPREDTEIPRPCPRLGVMTAVKRLQNIERNVIAESDELALRGLSRKHKKRLLAKTRSGISIVEEIENIHNGSSNKIEKKEKKRKLQPPQTSPKKMKLVEKSQETKKNDKKPKENGKNKLNKHKDKKNHVKPLSAKTDNNSNIKKPSVESFKPSVKSDKQLEKSAKLSFKSDKPSVKITKHSAKPVKPSVKTDKPSFKPSKPTVLSSKLSSKSLKPSIKTDKPSVKSIKPTIVSTKLHKKFTKTVKPSVKTDKPSTAMFTNENVHTPKKVKFVLKNNSMQKPVDYWMSIRNSPHIPFDGSKKPVRTNLKPSTPSPINPFFKKKMRIK